MPAPPNTWKPAFPSGPAASDAGKGNDRHEAFVVWLDRVQTEEGKPPILRGTVERTRDSNRTRFESADELIRVLSGDRRTGGM